MPPVTPSPHRFLFGQKRQQSPTKETRRPVPRNEVFQDAGDALRASSAQFVATPRFSAGKPKPPTGPSGRVSPTKHAIVDALRTASTARPYEDVEDASQEAHDDEEMLDTEQAAALPTTEDAETEPTGLHALPFSPKRLRVDELASYAHAHSVVSPARPAFRAPETPASHLPSTTPRFAPPLSSHSMTISDLPATQARTPFLRPSAAPQQEQSEPLPEAFSPHRRGQRFVPGGMAATVQQWVLETGQAAVQSRRGQGYLRGDAFAVKVKVEEVNGDGPYFVKAKTVDGELVKVMLVQSAAEATPREGSVIGIRAPTWDVAIEGKEWKVGIDWKVLS